MNRATIPVAVPTAWLSRSRSTCSRKVNAPTEARTEYVCGVLP